MSSPTMTRMFGLRAWAWAAVACRARAVTRARKSRAHCPMRDPSGVDVIAVKPCGRAKVPRGPGEAGSAPSQSRGPARLGHRENEAILGPICVFRPQDLTADDDALPRSQRHRPGVVALHAQLDRFTV